MANKLMYPNEDTQKYSFLDYNYRLKCLDIGLNEATNQNSMNVPKIFEPTNKKTLI